MVLPLSRLRRCRGVSAICAITLCLFLVNAVIFLGSLSELGSHESRFPRAVFSSAATRNQALVDSSIVKITQRLEKLENAVSRLQHSVASKIDNKKKDHHKACPIPSSWRYPFCARKVEWIQHLWTTNSQCYVDQHGIDPADECTILQFLSEAEAWCPLQPGRGPPQVQRNEAQTLTDLDGFLGILREDKFQWMRERATRLWPLWVQGIRSLEKRDHKLTNRKQKNILIMMGSFIMEPMFFYFAYRGGPLGEMVQWTDLIASLYILGHNITLCSNKTDVTRVFNVPEDKRCASKMRVDFDHVYTDYNGDKLMKHGIGPNHSQYRCRLRILDSFGTEAEFNLAEYDQPIPGGKSGWAIADVNLKQIMTMFPHSPDNTFLGFVVDGPVPQHRKTVKRKPIGLVYGKEARFWKNSRSYLDTLSKYLEIHATVAHFASDDEQDYIPKYVKNHGYLRSPQLQKLLKQTKVFIGLGFPYEGPAPLEAIQSGCVFLNAKFDPPHDRVNTPFFKNKPTLRKVTSQHPYAEEFIGKPHVYTIDITNTTVVEAAMQEILQQQVNAYLPLEWTPEGMLERVNTYLEHVDFCDINAKPWPPLDQKQVFISQSGQSCKDLCRSKGLVCESSYFVNINTADQIKRLNLTCRKEEFAAALHAPSYGHDGHTCILQTHPLLFSCVYAKEGHSRICPCRDFQQQQVALCKKC